MERVYEALFESELGEKESITSRDKKTIVFILGLARTGTSMYEGLNSEICQVLDEPCSWENGSINRKLLQAFRASDNNRLVIIRPMGYYTYKCTASVLRRLGYYTKAFFHVRNLKETQLSYWKRSVRASAGQDLTWYSTWDSYCLYEWFLPIATRRWLD